MGRRRRMTHEGQESFWPDAVPPTSPPEQKSRNPRGRGTRLRDRGCAVVLANEPDESFQEQGIRVARELQATGQKFAMEEIRDNMTIKPHHPNCWGALMREIRRLGILQVVGSKAHEFNSAHGRRIPVYQGTQKQELTWRN